MTTDFPILFHEECTDVPSWLAGSRPDVSPEDKLNLRSTATIFCFSNHAQFEFGSPTKISYKFAKLYCFQS